MIGLFIANVSARGRLQTINTQVGESVKATQINNKQCDMIYEFMSSQLAEKQRAGRANNKQ